MSIAISDRQALYKLYQHGLCNKENAERLLKEVKQPTKGYYCPDDVNNFINTLLNGTV